MGITKKKDFNDDVDRAEKQNISSTDVTFPAGTILRLTQEQGPNIVTLLSSRLDGKVVKFTVCLPDGTLFTAKHTQVAPLDDVNIASIPVSAADYTQELTHLRAQEAEAVAHPKPLSALSQEFLSWHNRLQHLPMTTMIALSKLGILPRRFHHIESNRPICASCLFDTAHHRSWSTKREAGTIRRARDDNPGKGVSTDQLVSSQAGLIPQFSGHLTRARIWGATIFVDHFSNHVHM